MESLSLSLDAAWAAGLTLSVSRVAAFAVASPVMARAVPLPGRLAAVLAIGLALAEPVGAGLTLPGLAAAAAVNAAVGAALGYLTGLAFHAFSIAGALIDATSGLSVAQVIDPTRGEQGAVFSRLFHLTALTLFYVVGGLALVVRGLALSVDVIALDGTLAAAPALARVAVAHTSRLMIAGAELAMPVMAALFVTEVVLGLAARFAPQANVFLLGLPAKILIALVMASLATLLLPEAVGGALDAMGDGFGTTLDGLRPGR